VSVSRTKTKGISLFGGGRTKQNGADILDRAEKTALVVVVGSF
jgi:hypothetical protein